MCYGYAECSDGEQDHAADSEALKPLVARHQPVRQGDATGHVPPHEYDERYEHQTIFREFAIGAVGGE